jgi:hypothetical protein
MFELVLTTLAIPLIWLVELGLLGGRVYVIESRNVRML